MPFVFNRVYRLSAVNDPGTAKQIVMGVRQRGDIFQFLIPASLNNERQLTGAVSSDKGDVMEVVSTVYTTPEGLPLVYRFEPLTLAMWLERKEFVSGYETLEKRFKSDADVQTFYLQDWLDDEYWKP